jgi:FlaA1/EpsC-like NDP-sugar epimerase
LGSNLFQSSFLSVFLHLKRNSKPFHFPLSTFKPTTISIQHQTPTTMAQQIDPDQFTTPFMITKTKHRDPYPAILPSNPSNSQKGKIIIITGASGGIGAVRSSFFLQLFFSRPTF